MLGIRHSWRKCCGVKGVRSQIAGLSCKMAVCTLLAWASACIEFRRGLLVCRYQRRAASGAAGLCRWVQPTLWIFPERRWSSFLCCRGPAVSGFGNTCRRHVVCPARAAAPHRPPVATGRNCRCLARHRRFFVLRGGRRAGGGEGRAHPRASEWTCRRGAVLSPRQGPSAPERNKWH